MKKTLLIITCALVSLVGCLQPVHATDENTLYLGSESAVLMDAATKRVLYNYNGETQHYPASITKVMTMLLGVESNQLNKEITLSEYGAMSIEVGSSHISLQPYETITMKDAIMAACLVSANDGANTIAEGVSGDIDTFVNLMNQRAKEIGCTNTHFVNPHGLHDEDHYSTPIDMAKIMSEAVMNETYVQLTNLDDYEIKPTNKTDITRYLYGQNKCMYSESEYYIPEVMSAKLGYTNEAGNTYLAYAKKGNMQLVACIMGASDGDTLYTDLQTLFNYGFENYQTYDKIADDLKIPDLDHSLFTTGGTLVLKEAFAIPSYTQNEIKNFDFVYDIDETLGKEAKTGEVVGQVHLTYQDEILVSRDVVVEKPLNNIITSFFKFLFNVIKTIVIIILLGIGLLLLSKKIYTKYKNDQIRKRRQNRRP